MGFINKHFMWLLCFFLAGCVTTTSEPERPVQSQTSFSVELTNIRQVRLKMTEQEVATLMGDTINVGYQASESSGEGYQAIPIQSPYREEILKGKRRIYKVVYYFTHIRKSDGVVSEDELTPLVFEKGLLIGKGKDFLSTLRNKEGF